MDAVLKHLEKSKKHYNNKDRVTIRKCFVDGTWQEKGNKCIDSSPVIIGTITRVSFDGASYLYDVDWDTGEKSGTFFGHAFENVIRM